MDQDGWDSDQDTIIFNPKKALPHHYPAPASRYSSSYTQHTHPSLHPQSVQHPSHPYSYPVPPAPRISGHSLTYTSTRPVPPPPPLLSQLYSLSPPPVPHPVPPPSSHRVPYVGLHADQVLSKSPPAAQGPRPRTSSRHHHRRQIHFPRTNTRYSKMKLNVGSLDLSVRGFLDILYQNRGRCLKSCWEREIVPRVPPPSKPATAPQHPMTEPLVDSPDQNLEELLDGLEEDLEKGFLSSQEEAEQSNRNGGSPDSINNLYPASYTEPPHPATYSKDPLPANHTKPTLPVNHTKPTQPASHTKPQQPASHTKPPQPTSYTRDPHPASPSSRNPQTAAESDKCEKVKSVSSDLAYGVDGWAGRTRYAPAPQVSVGNLLLFLKAKASEGSLLSSQGQGSPSASHGSSKGSSDGSVSPSVSKEASQSGKHPTNSQIDETVMLKLLQSPQGNEEHLLVFEKNQSSSQPPSSPESRGGTDGPGTDANASPNASSPEPYGQREATSHRATKGVKEREAKKDERGRKSDEERKKESPKKKSNETSDKRKTNLAEDKASKKTEQNGISRRRQQEREETEERERASWRNSDDRNRKRKKDEVEERGKRKRKDEEEERRFGKNTQDGTRKRKREEAEERESWKSDKDRNRRERSKEAERELGKNRRKTGKETEARGSWRRMRQSGDRNTSSSPSPVKRSKTRESTATPSPAKTSKSNARTGYEKEGRTPTKAHQKAKTPPPATSSSNKAKISSTFTSTGKPTDDTHSLPRNGLSNTLRQSSQERRRTPPPQAASKKDRSWTSPPKTSSRDRTSSPSPQITSTDRSRTPTQTSSERHASTPLAQSSPVRSTGSTRAPLQVAEEDWRNSDPPSTTFSSEHISNISLPQCSPDDSRSSTRSSPMSPQLFSLSAPNSPTERIVVKKEPVFADINICLSDIVKQEPQSPDRVMEEQSEAVMSVVMVKQEPVDGALVATHNSTHTEEPSKVSFEGLASGCGVDGGVPMAYTVVEKSEPYMEEECGGSNLQLVMKTEPTVEEEEEKGDGAHIKYLMKSTMEVLGMEEGSGVPDIWDGSTPETLYSHLKNVLQMMECSVWEEDDSLSYMWEVNLRRLVVATFCRHELARYTRNIRRHMQESLDLKVFVRSVMSSNSIP